MYDIRQALGNQTTLLDKVVQRRLRWFGHVERMSNDQVPHNSLHARFKGKRNKGRPRLRWIENVKEDIESFGLTLRGAMGFTKDRGQWRSFITSPPNDWHQELNMYVCIVCMYICEYACMHCICMFLCMYDCM